MNERLSIQEPSFDFIAYYLDVMTVHVLQYILIMFIRNF